MDDLNEDGNAFAIPKLWKVSTLVQFNEESEDPQILDLEPLKLLNGRSIILKDLNLRLPDLSTFAYGPIADFDGVDTSSVSSLVESIDVHEALEADIWSFPNTEEKEEAPAKIKSWEAFYDNDFQQLRTPYLSEAGPQIFDAALAIETGNPSPGQTNSSEGRVIQSDPLLKSLIQLGLGFESILYRYSDDESSFRPNIEDGRMSGYSPQVFSSLSSVFIHYGNNVRQLRSFIDETQISNTAVPALVALTGCLSSILTSLQAQIAGGMSQVCSLLQLQCLFERPGEIMVLISQVRWKVDGASTDEDLLSRLYEMTEDSENGAAWRRPMLFNILSSISKPWLESVGGWLGFKTNPAFTSHDRRPRFPLASEGLRKLDSGKETIEIEDQFEPIAMPNFIVREDAQLIFEAGQSLRLLETHRPEHPLVKPPVVKSDETVNLEWRFSWEHLNRIQAQAKEYKSNLQAAIIEFEAGGESAKKSEGYFTKTELDGINSTRLSEESAKAYIAASITTFEKPMADVIGRDEVWDSVLLSVLHADKTPEKEILAPPVSVLPALSFNPLVLAQANLVNRACLRLLFKEHNVRSHFSLLHRFSLFGDGVFTSRLCHSLFDPDLQSSERRKGHTRAGTSGLKLGSRETWPPASSELRLALMGILTECYDNTGHSEASSMFRAELPGGLSFSIREMSEEELQRCMDPNSIEALDFLRLQYKPPPPLDAVITDVALAKYDLIFKLLLRAVRMSFVVNQFFRDEKISVRGTDFPSQRFKIECHHFVSAVCGYFFDGVQANWGILDQRLKDIERRLNRDSTDSLAKLREFHEQILDRIMFTLILRKRQAQVLRLLEEIFGLILRFARQRWTQVRADDSKIGIQEIYEKFKKKIRVFISVCRGLSERRGQGSITGQEHDNDAYENDNISEDGGNKINHLLLKFEMSGFYAR